MNGRGLCLALTALAALALGSPSADAASTYRIDDSASLPNETSLAMRWRNASTHGTVGDTVEGVTRVTLRLNVAPWQNRNARIYMVLPPQPIGSVNVEWTTQGRLLAGRLGAGERTLVYVGVVRSPLIEDTFTVRVETDGRRLANPQRMQFHFEIDVD